MNNTTGADATALSMACLVSEDRYRKAIGEIRGVANLEAIVGAGRAACRNAFLVSVHLLFHYIFEFENSPTIKLVLLASLQMFGAGCCVII